MPLLCLITSFSRLTSGYIILPSGLMRSCCCCLLLFTFLSRLSMLVESQRQGRSRAGPDPHPPVCDKEEGSRRALHLWGTILFSLLICNGRSIPRTKRNLFCGARPAVSESYEIVTARASPADAPPSCVGCTRVVCSSVLRPSEEFPSPGDSFRARSWTPDETIVGCVGPPTRGACPGPDR